LHSLFLAFIIQSQVKNLTTACSIRLVRLAVIQPALSTSFVGQKRPFQWERKKLPLKRSRGSAVDPRPQNNLVNLDFLVNLDPEFVISTRVRCGLSLEGKPKSNLFLLFK
jgi:hypothetical protein